MYARAIGNNREWSVSNRFFFFTLCLVLLAIGMGCGGSSDGNSGNGDIVDTSKLTVNPYSGGVLTTGNGDITVTIPSGALNEITTITVKRVAVSSIPPTVGADNADVNFVNAVSISLGPVGTTFNPEKPARIKVKLPDAEPAEDTGNGAGMAVPVGFLYLVSEDGSVDVPANVEVEMDPATGAVCLTADVFHFSELTWVPIKGINLLVYGVSDARPVNMHFLVCVQLTGPMEIDSAIDPTYSDDSVDPVVYNEEGDPTSIPISPYNCLIRNYQCGATPLKGTYRATVNLNYKTETIQIGETLVPTRFLVDKHTFKQPVTCYDSESGSISDTENKISIILPETDSGGVEHGKFKVAFEFSAPEDEAVTIPVMLGGDAIPGKDFGWGIVGGDDPQFDLKFRMEPGELRLEWDYHAIDDNDEDGPKTLTFIPGTLDGFVMDPLTALTFIFDDDPDEPIMRGAGITFSATPAAQTQTVGQSASVTLEQTVNDDAGDHIFVARFYNLNPDILDDPVLLPVGSGHGTEEVSLYFLAPLLPVLGVYEGWVLEVDDLAVGTANQQTLQFPCLEEGTGTVEIEFNDETGNLLIGSGMLLGGTDVTVTCEYPPPPSFEWVEEIQLNFNPEAFGGFLGPRVVSNSGSEGDPFGDSARPRPNPPRDILDLDPERDYAIVAMHGTEDYTGRTGIYDLSDGTEVTRLRGPTGYTLGALVLISPDFEGVVPEWMLTFTKDGGYNRNNYNADTKEWGMTRFFPGGFVRDIVGGPVDENGRDTGYIVVNTGQNTVRFAVWDAGEGLWGGMSGVARYSGRWFADSDGVAVSAVGGFNGPALVLVDNGVGNTGSLWTFDPRSDDSDTDLLLGAVGFGPQLLRCLNGVCVATNQTSDTITTVLWTAPGNTPVIIDTQTVGEGPKGIDLIPDPGGNGILALTTGWSADNFTVTHIGADANVIESTITPLSDCHAPSYGHFTDGEGTHVLISCTESQKVVIVPR